MSDNKKYYYLKLKDNFYDSEEMIILQNMPDGYLYSDILMKLYLRSLKNNGKLMFKDVIPYTPAALAQVVRHQVGTVEKALKIFQDIGLIEVLDNGAIYMLDIQNFIGKSSTEADRIRNYRGKIKQEEQEISEGNNKDVQMLYKCTPEIEIELDIEKEIEQEQDKIINFYNNNIGSITPYQYQILNSYIEDGMDPELIIHAMEIAAEQNKRSISYIKAILNSYRSKNIKNMADAIEDENKFRNKPGKTETAEEEAERLRKEWGIEDDT